MDQVEGLRIQISELKGQIDKQRQIQSEELNNAESLRQQALLIAQQEQTMVMEQNKVSVLKMVIYGVCPIINGGLRIFEIV